MPVLLLSVQLLAQQRPHYTQYILNNYILNPALSGIETLKTVSHGTHEIMLGFLIGNKYSEKCPRCW